jgi:flagellin
MTVINTNIAASITANAMKSKQRVMENNMERLTRGMRINSASDDAAGLAIGSKMEAQIRGLGQAVRNANDGISMIQTADGAAIEIGDMLQRMRELAVQAANGTNGSAELSNINKEFQALATEIDRVADDVTFNSTAVISGAAGTKNFTIGADQADTVSVLFGDFNLAAGNSDATAAQFDLNLNVTQLQAVANGKTIRISNADGATIDVTTTLIEAEIDLRNGSGSDTSGFTNATLADFALAATDAITANSSFGAYTVSVNSTEGIRFTQTTAGTGAAITGAVALTEGAVTTAAIADLTFDTQVPYTAGTTGVGVMAADISDFKTAVSGGEAQKTTTIAELDAAISGVASARATFGAAINSLEHSIDSLNGAVQNTMSAKSAIMDADYAAETTELARTQILAQASTAMLSQANQQQQSVLALLK